MYASAALRRSEIVSLLIESWSCRQWRTWGNSSSCHRSIPAGARAGPISRRTSAGSCQSRHGDGDAGCKTESHAQLELNMDPIDRLQTGDHEATMEKSKILIVDDDPDLRRGLNLRLRANQYDTVYAEDAFSAVSMAEKEHPQLILLDLGLPAQDGFAVLEKLQRNPSLGSIPVIVLSARDPYQNQNRALQAGADAYFQKPADNGELLDAIRTILQNSISRSSDC